MILSELLTPENCYSSIRLREFLRLSRIASDDGIRQHLNLVKSKEECDKYFQNSILPEWKARAEIIEYCSAYSAQLRDTTSRSAESRVACLSYLNDQSDPRVDPYAQRSLLEEKERRFQDCDFIDNWVKNEKIIDDILKESTQEVLNQKCYYRKWIESFKKFKN